MGHRRVKGRERRVIMGGILAAWSLTAVVAASCAQGSGPVDLTPTTSSAVSSSTGLGGGVTSSTVSASSNATVSSSSAGGFGGAGGAPASSTNVVGVGGFTAVSSVAVTSTSVSSSSGGTSDAGDGFGSCVTQTDYDNQGEGCGPGFCNNFLASLGCGLFCDMNGVDAGDIVCSPTCVCAPMPPICGTEDAGSDAAADDDGGVPDADTGDADMGDADVGDAGTPDAALDAATD